MTSNLTWHNNTNLVNAGYANCSSTCTSTLAHTLPKISCESTIVKHMLEHKSSLLYQDGSTSVQASYNDDISSKMTTSLVVNISTKVNNTEGMLPLTSSISGSWHTPALAPFEQTKPATTNKQSMALTECTSSAIVRTMRSHAPVVVPVSAAQRAHKNVDGPLSKVGGAAGLTYALIFPLWTIALLPGMYMIYAKRKSNAVKIRDWRLIFLGIAAVQTFVFVCFVAYWAGHSFTCSRRFWVVSLFQPLCVAAFQLSNVRVANYYETNLQASKLARRFSNPTSGLWWRQIASKPWSKQATIAQKANFILILGMALQVLMATFLYFSSRRFHNIYGLWGPTEPSAMELCLRGPEWTVSIVLQVLWAFGVGVCLLPRIWRIHDIYYYWLETMIAICCSIVPLALWMTFMFAQGPAIDLVDTYAVPAIWFAPFTGLLQVLLIYLPLRGVSRDARERLRAHRQSLTTTSRQMMSRFIDKHADMLIRYAAKTRFNAELIIFLHEVEAWRKLWSGDTISDWEGSWTSVNSLKCYKHAALIYFRLVDSENAMFPINIEAKNRESLKRVFRHAILRDETHQIDEIIIADQSVTPWDFEDARSARESVTDIGITVSEAQRQIDIRPRKFGLTSSTSTEGLILTDQVAKDTNALSQGVFDRAVAEVKQLAYENIWVHYVDTPEFKRYMRTGSVS